MNAQSAGAIAVVIYNNAQGILSLDVTLPGIHIPTYGLTKSDGEALMKILNASKGANVPLVWLEVDSQQVNPTGGEVSDFSSWGLGPDLDIKPDIGAPGGLIWSTYPLAKGGYAVLSG